MKSPPDFETQIIGLLRAVGEHSIASWPHPQLVAAMTLCNQAAPDLLARATCRFVSRELRSLMSARDLQVASMGAAIEGLRVNDDGSEQV